MFIEEEIKYLESTEAPMVQDVEEIKELENDVSDGEDEQNEQEPPSQSKGDSTQGPWCICRTIVESQDMIACEGDNFPNNNWLHFRCVGISEEQADTIERYLCDVCSL